MRWLKALVIGMAVLIVVGTAVIAVTLARRSAGDGAAADGAATSSAPARLALPAGARVIETALDGDRLALRIALAGGGERIVIIDARTGRRVAAVDLVPADAKPAP